MKKLLSYVLLALLSWLPWHLQAQNLTDLVVVAPFTLPGTVQAGGTYPMAAGIKNQGTNGSQFNCIGFYLSADSRWDANDAYLGASCQSLLFPGQSGTCSINATIPAGTVPGAYFLVLVADPLNAEAELNETNNVVSFAVGVTAGSPNRPDLTLWRPTIGFSALPAGGSTGSFTFISNAGAAAVGAYEIGYYLSRDTVFSASTDVYLGNLTGGGLSAGVMTVHFMPVLTVPAGTAPGDYYLVLMIDPRNVVAESNESNNSRALPLRVTGTVAGITGSAEHTLEVYPNPLPAGTAMRVQLGEAGQQGATSLTLYDALGRVLLRQPVAATAASVALDTRQVPAGVYLLRLTGPHLNAARRVVIQ